MYRHATVRLSIKGFTVKVYENEQFRFGCSLSASCAVVTMLSMLGVKDIELLGTTDVDTVRSTLTDAGFNLF